MRWAEERWGNQDLETDYERFFQKSNEVAARREYGVKERSFTTESPDQHCVIILIIHMRRLGPRECT